MIVSRHRHYKLLYVCYVFFSFLNTSSFSYLIIIITITENGFKRVNCMLQMIFRVRLVHYVICVLDSGDWNNGSAADKELLFCDFKDVRVPHNSWYCNVSQLKARRLMLASDSAVRSILNRIEMNGAAAASFHVVQNHFMWLAFGRYKYSNAVHDVLLLETIKIHNRTYIYVRIEFRCMHFEIQTDIFRH